jgi:predicted XRE-type DNA-binding protein
MPVVAYDEIAMAKKPLIPVTLGSGNVFADIDVPEPEEALAKAQLASRIREIVRRSRLTQVAAAVVMGVDQPKVSALLSGRLTNFSSERLMRLLTRLGQDVEIVVKDRCPGAVETETTPARAHQRR